MSDEIPMTVSRASIARKIREGIAEQGWAVVEDRWLPDASWLAAAERICEHLERKGIEVKR